MCTLSIIALAQGGATGYRVLMNRDEQRARAEAIPPAWRELAPDVQAIAPTDPQGGGTWIAATTHGLTLGVTNVNPRPYPNLPARMESRGRIIPTLAACASVAAVRARFAHLDLDRFAPFRLVAVGLEGACVVAASWRWDRRQLEHVEQHVPPTCFVSSGLGDERVAPRLELFQEILAKPTAAAQDAFHRHTWPGREDVSVLMSRDDARTVSITSVVVERPADLSASAGVGVVGVVGGGIRVAMDYEPVADASRK